MSETTITERVHLDADTITAGASVFQPHKSETTARVEWVLNTMEAHNITATDVGKDVEAYYQLQGFKTPRGYKRASIVNAASTGKLWEQAGTGKSGDKTASRTYHDLVDLLDAAREAHGAKTVKSLLTELGSTLDTGITALNRYRATYDAVQALLNATPDAKDSTDPVSTFATFVRRAQAVREYGGAIPTEAWDARTLSDEDRETLEGLAALIKNALSV